MPRLLIVTASARRRGAEIQATQLATALRATGADVDVVALAAGGATTPLDVEVLGRWRFDPRGLVRLWRRRRRADITVAYGSSALPASILAGIGTRRPLIYRSISDPAHWVRGRLHRSFTGWQYRRADMVITLGATVAATAIDLFGLAPSRVRVITNARRAADHRPPTTGERHAARRSLGVDGLVVAFIGSLSDEKRPDLAVDAVAGDDTMTLVMAGDGPLATATREHADRVAPGRVRMLGPLDDVRDVLWAADVVLIPSDVEGMPGVAIEAGLAGVPVVARAVGTIPEMPFVRLVADDADSMRAAIRDANGSTPAGVDRYVWERVVPSWRAAFDELPPRRSTADRVVAGLRARAGRLPPVGVIAAVRTDVGAVGLTFDDGPDPVFTPALLDVLGRHRARATFFVLGDRAARHPELIARMRAEGHTVASHTVDHRSLTHDAPRRWRHRVRWRRMQLSGMPEGVDRSLWRPPYGHLSVGAALGAWAPSRRCIGWSIDARDYRAEPAEVIVDRVLGALAPGAIVLFHDGLANAAEPEAFDRRATVEAVDQILTRVAGRFDAVTISDLRRVGRPHRVAPRSPRRWDAPAFEATEPAVRPR